MNFKYILFTFILFAQSFEAHAYLDPGTGSLILQALFGILAAIGAYITLYWRKLKNLLNKIFKKNKDS
tara:strand:+ start:342 stop:545 length:204 start_codon:yes stop_codon:yes gene_type:complete